MKIKCDYCNNTYEDTLPKCPYCEAPNPSHKQTKGAPKTIAELEQWYKDRKLPPYETTRFFIGQDHKGPRAFGIYQDPGSGEFIVYKNKNDGSRAVRYQGKDEEYAVNELYQKLKDEIVHQKANQGKNTSSSSNRSKGFSLFRNTKLSTWIIIAIMIASVLLNLSSHRHDGYYNYNDTVYYSYDDNWYYYDNYYDDWYTTNSYDPGVTSIQNSYDDYYVSDYWNPDMNATDWDDSPYYEETHSYSSSDYDSSSDSDWDWDSGSSWDSGGSDWDSDW